MREHDFMYDCQAQTSTPPLPTCAGWVDLIETFEDMWNRLFRDPRAAISNADFHLRSRKLRLQGNFASAGRMPERILDQVGEHLRQPVAVPDQGRSIGWRIEIQADFRFLCLQAEFLDDAVQ
jgi:hypothetical protein